MKICIITNLYPPYARGGAEQVVHKIAEELATLGHSLVIITLTPGVAEKAKEGNVTIYRIHPRNLFFYTDAHHHSLFARFLWHLIDIFHLTTRKKIRDILGEEKPDVVHTHNLMGLGFLLPRLIKKLDIRHIHTVHDVQLVEPSGIILKKYEKNWRYTGLATKIYTAIMRTLFGSPQVVISPSQFLLQFYEERKFFQNSRRIVMRNPITLPTSIATDTKNKMFTFLYVGQIEEHKGVHFLVESFLDFVQKNNNCELHIVGSGSSLEILKQQAAHELRIIFHGKVERARLPEFFGRSNITVVPSLCYENSPTVIFESLAFSVPVLASNIEGIAELIHEGENGLTFEAENKQSLQEKFEWCLNHQEEVKQMGTRGKETLLHFSKEDYLEQLLSIYKGTDEVLTK